MEAAMVLQIVLIIFIGMLYFVVFLHDYITVRIITNKYVIEVAYVESKDNKPFQEIIQAKLEDLMIVCEVKSVSIKVDKGMFYNKANITTIITLNTPFDYVNKLINGSSFTYNVNSDSTNVRGKNLLIPIAAIDQISNKVTEIGKIKSKYLDDFNKLIEKLIEGSPGED